MALDMISTHSMLQDHFLCPYPGCPKSFPSANEFFKHHKDHAGHDCPGCPPKTKKRHLYDDCPKCIAKEVHTHHDRQQCPQSKRSNFKAHWMRNHWQSFPPSFLPDFSAEFWDCSCGDKNILSADKPNHKRYVKHRGPDAIEATFTLAEAWASIPPLDTTRNNVQPLRHLSFTTAPNTTLNPRFRNGTSLLLSEDL